MAQSSKLDGKIAGQGPDISSLADDSFEFGLTATELRYQPKVYDLHWAGGQRRQLIGASQRIRAATPDFDGRIDRRRLCDRTDKARQNRFDRSSAWPRAALPDDVSFAIVSSAGNTPPDPEAIRFAAVHRIGRGFRRFTECYWQHSGRQR